MNLLTPVHVAVLSQLYWLVLLFCGYVFFHAFFRLIRKNVPDFWTKSYFLGKIALSFAIINVVFFAWSVMGYLFTLPSAFLGISFGITVLFSVVYACAFMRVEIVAGVKCIIQAARNLRLFSWITAAIVVLILDFVLNIRFGAYLGGDALIHIANVRDLAENGFRLIDPAYGVPDATYLFVVWHVLIAIPSYLGIDAVNSWLYSLPIAKIAIVSCLCFLLLQLLKLMTAPRRQIKTWVYIAALFFLLIPSTANSFMASYPNKLVIAWMALLVAGIFLYANQVKHKQWSACLLIFISSLLISITHPLYSAFAFLLMMAVAVLVILFSRRIITKQAIVTWLCSLFILILTPVINAFINRNGRTTELQSYNDSFQYWELFDMKAFLPTGYNVLSPVSDGVLYVIGLVGFIGLIWLVKGRINKLLVGIIISFPLLVTLPPIFEVMNKVLPIWAIHRMFGVDVLIHLAPLLALVGVVMLIRHLLNHYKLSLLSTTATTTLLAMLTVLYLLVIHGMFNIEIWRNYILSRDTEKTRIHGQYKKYEMIMDTQNAIRLVPQGATVVTRVGDAPRVSAAGPVRIFAMSVGHTSSLVLDIEQRVRCTKRIFSSANSADDVAGYLLQIEARYIMLLKGSKLNESMGKSEKFTRLTKSSQAYQLYRLDSSTQLPVPDTACSLK